MFWSQATAGRGTFPPPKQCDSRGPSTEGLPSTDANLKFVFFFASTLDVCAWLIIVGLRFHIYKKKVSVWLVGWFVGLGLHLFVFSPKSQFLGVENRVPQVRDLKNKNV